MNGMDNRRTILHVLAGGYLLYLAYTIFGGIIRGETPANRTMLMIICGAAFGIIGAILLIHALVAKIKAIQNPEEEPEEDAEETEEEVEALEEGSPETENEDASSQETGEEIEAQTDEKEGSQ